MDQPQRLREHAWRWFFAEDPEALPPEERLRLTEWLHRRVHNGGDFTAKIPYLTTLVAMDAVLEMHVTERDAPHSLTPAERTAAMARRTELLNYFVFIDQSAKDLLEQQEALIRASTMITSGFDGVTPAEETIRSITRADKPSPSPRQNPPVPPPIDLDIGF